MRDVRDSSSGWIFVATEPFDGFKERKWATTAVSIQAVIYFGARSIVWTIFCRDHVDPGSFVRPAVVGGQDVLLPLNQQRHPLLLFHLLMIIPRPEGRQPQLHRYNQILQFFRRQQGHPNNNRSTVPNATNLTPRFHYRAGNSLRRPWPHYDHLVDTPFSLSSPPR
jgi:hypothetical protein